MGQAAAEAVDEAPDFELAGLVDTAAKRADTAAKKETPFYSSLEESLEDADPFAAVDFTQADAATASLKILAARGIHAVVGTSGIDEKAVKELAGEFKKSNCLIAPNFSISAVLMMRLAEMAAPHFESAEIIEMHHESKADAPSGTAIETMRRMQAASDFWLEDPTTQENLPGSRGAGDTKREKAEKGGIRIHSVRLKGLVAHQEVLLGTSGQSLSIRQDTYDRSAFMPGVLLGLRQISSHPGLTVGLDKFLGI